MMNVTDYNTHNYNAQLFTSETSNREGVLLGTGDDENKLTSQIETESLGKDDFLKLLLAQLRNQDPLNPADNTEFVAQLAQFSTLEQLTTINSSLEQSLNYNKNVSESINNSMMVNFIGRTVSAESNVFAYDGENPAVLQFELDKDIDNGKVEILNGEEKVIRILPLGELGKGHGTIPWDGLTSLGVKAGAGNYTYTVTTYDSVGNESESVPVFTGVVEGVSYRDGVANLGINGVLVPFDKVKHIFDE